MSDISNKITQFWVCNISDRNVSLSDLRVTIKARSGVNLLDSKHYSYTYEQLKESMKSGSIWAKRDKIKVGKGPPQDRVIDEKTLSTRPLVVRSRTCVKTTETTEYDEEFIFSDEQYAEEMAREFDEDY